jgi:hypothetical protein
MLLALLPAGCASVPDVAGPIVTWREDPTTAATIVWLERDEVAAPNELWYRPLGEAAWRRTDAVLRPFASAPAVVREVSLDDLQPDTEYELALGAEVPVEAPALRFRTAPRRLERPLRFVTGGDMYHARWQLDAMNTRAGLLEPDFALLGGDLAYANTQEWRRWLTWVDSWSRLAVSPDGRMIPMIVAIGNHETDPDRPLDDPLRAPLFDAIFAPEGRTYRAVDVGADVSVVVLDSGHRAAIGGAQRRWLESALAARADRPVVFACYHRPAFGTAKPPEEGVRRRWVPLFERFEITAVFENDHHTYKRSEPIRDGRIDRDHGILYLGDGAWGVRVRDVPSACASATSRHPTTSGTSPRPRAATTSST